MPPVPKRTDQRRRRNKPEIEYTFGVKGKTGDRPGPDPNWHRIALNYYRAFVNSGQTEFWEPSDWALLHDVLDDISDYKRSGKRSAGMRAAIDGALARLLVAEGDRRRARVELHADESVDADDDASVTAMNEHMRRLSG